MNTLRILAGCLNVFFSIARGSGDDLALLVQTRVDGTEPRVPVSNSAEAAVETIMNRLQEEEAVAQAQAGKLKLNNNPKLDQTVADIVTNIVQDSDAAVVRAKAAAVAKKTSTKRQPERQAQQAVPPKPPSSPPGPSPSQQKSNHEDIVSSIAEEVFNSVQQKGEPTGQVDAIASATEQILNNIMSTTPPAPPPPPPPPASPLPKLQPSDGADAMTSATQEVIDIVHEKLESDRQAMQSAIDTVMDRMKTNASMEEESTAATTAPMESTPTPAPITTTTTTTTATTAQTVETTTTEEPATDKQREEQAAKAAAEAEARRKEKQLEDAEARYQELQAIHNEGIGSEGEGFAANIQRAWDGTSVGSEEPCGK